MKVPPVSLAAVFVWLAMSAFAEPEVALPAARALADSVVNEVLHQRHEQLHGRMERAYRQSVSAEQFAKTLEPMYTYGGKPLSAKFKDHELGIRLYEDGTRKPMRKFWYALATTKAKPGTYLLFVEIVAEGETLVCASFSIVAFANGPPPHLAEPPAGHDA